MSAVFTAVAALAALGTVLLDLRRQREGRLPRVAAGFGVLPNMQVRLSFANAGPGLATALMYLGVAEGAKFGGTVGSGHLVAGAETAVYPGIRVSGRTGEATFIWVCYDADHNMHLWSYAGQYKRVGHKEVLSRHVIDKPKLGDFYATVRG